MIRFSGTIVWRDGRDPSSFAGGPVEWVQWERYAVSHGLPVVGEDAARAVPITQALFGAYAVLTRGANPRPGFDKWLEQVADLTGYEVKGSDPPRPEHSDGLSPSSHRSPASPPLISTGASRTI